MNPLVKITCELQPDGTWTCTRERQGSAHEGGGGEKAVGLSKIEVIEFIEAHDWPQKEEL